MERRAYEVFTAQAVCSTIAELQLQKIKEEKTMQEEVTQKTIILQSKSQLKAIYKDNADTIEGNCDTTLFLGGKEKTTLKELAEVLGKETIDLYNTSDTRGTSQSYGLNYQKTGKDMPYLFVKSSVALNLS